MAHGPGVGRSASPWLWDSVTAVPGSDAVSLDGPVAERGAMSEIDYGRIGIEQRRRGVWAEW